MSNEVNIIVTLDGYTESGATFTPHISEDGLLSWTNDMGLPNPEPIIIKGKAMTFDDLTDEQKEELKGEKGEPGAVDFAALTEEQKAELKGDPFTYEDFTEEQLEALRGPAGEPFEYEDLTDEQKAELKGEKGDPFTYEDFTDKQLEALKVKGDPGEPGKTPVKGKDYWTESDRSEIVNDVFDMVVNGNEVAY